MLTARDRRLLAIGAATSPRAAAFALRAVGMPAPRGMGDVRGEASTDDKAMLTATALGLFGRSTALQGQPLEIAEELRGEVQAALAQLNGFLPWTDTSRFWSSATWDDSQTVRSNLQQALENVDIASGQTSSGAQVSSTWRPQTEVVKPVDVTTETFKNLPGEIKKRGEELTTGTDWAGILKKAAIGLAIGVPVVAGTLVYVHGRGMRRANPRRERH